MSVDKVSKKRISLLHPYISKEVYDLVDHINKDILTGRAKLRIAQGLRTIEEQNELYAKGRTKPGPKVTNAKGGDSIHNYGLAVDMVLIIDGKSASWDVKKDWDGDKQADWMEVVLVFKKAGYEWGGDWRSFVDMPHFQKTKGNNLEDLKRKYKNKEFISGTNFVKL